MREIKFRAWDKESKEMFFPAIEVTGFKNADMNEAFAELNKNFMLMQYTCLKDKNGKEIYEGDIVRGWGDFSHSDYPSQEIQTGIAEFRGSAFIIKNIDKHCRGIDIKLWYDLEKIGNVYENPELVMGIVL